MKGCWRLAIGAQAGVGAGRGFDPQERQIARRARDGLSELEIGARLFGSPRTMEWYLRKVFGQPRIARASIWAVLLASSEAQSVTLKRDRRLAVAATSPRQLRSFVDDRRKSWRSSESVPPRQI
jgi:DNA-binding CsgD family transcriptional regulator